MNIDTNKKSTLLLKLSGVVTRPLTSGAGQPVCTDTQTCVIPLNGHDEKSLREQMVAIFNKIIEENSK